MSPVGAPGRRSETNNKWKGIRSDQHPGYPYNMVENKKTTEKLLLSTKQNRHNVFQINIKCERYFFPSFQGSIFNQDKRFRFSHYCTKEVFYAKSFAQKMYVINLFVTSLFGSKFHQKML